ncbi:hypothetical protein BC938DRAFT_477591, partial [Jimgerdemannia flammicorona]
NLRDKIVPRQSPMLQQAFVDITQPPMNKKLDDEIQNLRRRLEEEKKHKAVLDETYNSLERRYEGIEKYLGETKKKNEALQNQNRELKQKLVATSTNIETLKNDLPAKRDEAELALHESQRQRDALRKLTALALIQQNVLSKLEHVQQCEKWYRDTEAKALDVVEDEFEQFDLKIQSLKDQNENLATRGRQRVDNIHQLRSRISEMESKVAHLETLDTHGAAEQARRTQLQQERDVNLQQFRHETKLFEQSVSNQKGAVDIKIADLRKRCNSIAAKTQELSFRTKAHAEIREIESNLGDRCLKPPNWSVLPLQRTKTTNILHCGDEGIPDLRSLSFEPSKFYRHDDYASYRFAFEGRWNNGDFRCVFHVRDEDDDEFVGKVFILRRGLNIDFACAERSLKTLLLAKIAARAFREPLCAALAAVGAPDPSWVLR